jgi:hypothetical protein
MSLSRIDLAEFAEVIEGRGLPAGLPLFLEGAVYVPPEGNSGGSQKLQDVAFAYSLATKKKKRKDAPQTLVELRAGCRNSWMTTIHRNGVSHPAMVRILNKKVYWGRVVKVRHEILVFTTPEIERLNILIHSFATRVESSFIDAEKVALKKLKTMIPPAKFEHYVLTDMFIEQGKSGVHYVLRKNRPTVAVSNNNVLCALCLHPGGYYGGSWTGVLCPTDEVIAHLLLIRGDEHFFWKKANHIPIQETNSGV